MKKSILIGMLVISLAAFLAVGTWAWFTAEAEPVTNKFTTGTVKIEIVDVYEDEGASNWNPGDTTNKDVSIKSLGTKCAYVRVKLTPVWGDIVEGKFVADPSLSADNVTLNWNPVDWMLHTDDGYYYYKGILPAGGVTPLLLDSVTLVGADTDNNYQGKVFQILIEADAVQCTNDAYKSVWGMDNLPWVNP